MSKKIKQIEAKTHTEQYNTFVSKVLKTDNVYIADMDVQHMGEILEWLDTAPVEQQANKRQYDADLWDMLSFRGTQFADIIADIQTCIKAGKPISENLLEKYAMCVIRSTFKDLIKKGADEWQTAVYDDFRHDIRLEMSRRMANDTAYEINRNRKGEMIRACADENAETVLDNATAETFGAGMDLMHAIIVRLLECIADGNDFEKVMFVEQNRKMVVNPWETVERVTKETSIVQQTFKACRDEIHRQASIKAVDNGYTYIEMKTRTTTHGQSMYIDAVCADDRDGYMDEEIYWRTKQNFFTGECTSSLDLENYTQLIHDLHLTDIQIRRLEMKAKGYSIEQIAGEEGKTRRAIQKSIEQCRQKALDWLIEKDIEMSVDAVTDGQTGAEMFSLAEYLNKKQAYDIELETDIDTYKTVTKQYLAGKYKPQGMPMVETLPKRNPIYETEGTYPSWYEMYGPAYKYTKDENGYITGIESAE